MYSAFSSLFYFYQKKAQLMLQPHISQQYLFYIIYSYTRTCFDIYMSSSGSFTFVPCQRYTSLIMTHKCRNMQEYTSISHKRNRQISEETLEAVMRSFLTRVRLCIEEGGDHLKDIVHKKRKLCKKNFFLLLHRGF